MHNPSSPVNRNWYIPVTWSMTGYIEVEAPTLAQAMEIAEAEDNAFPCPTDGEYVTGSWELCDDDIDSLRENNDGQEDFNIAEYISDLKQAASELGAELFLDESRIIDNQHLDCFWYGGEIGFVQHRGWKASVVVEGEVHVRARNGSFVFNDSTGAWGKVWITNDTELWFLTKRGMLIFDKKSRVAINVIRPDGSLVVTLGDTIFADNVLDAFYPITKFTRIIDRLILAGDGPINESTGTPHSIGGLEFTLDNGDSVFLSEHDLLGKQL